MDNNQFFRDATLLICGDLALERALHATLVYIRKYLPVDTMFAEYFDPGLARIIHHALPAGCSLTQNTYEQSLAHDESDPTAHLRPGSIPRPGCFFSFAPPFRPDWAAGVIGYIATSRRCISTHSALSG